MIKEKWIKEAVGDMHENGLNQSVVADKVGYSREWFNKIINYKCNPPKDAKEKINKAIKELIEEQKNNEKQNI